MAANWSVYANLWPLPSLKKKIRRTAYRTLNSTEPSRRFLGLGTRLGRAQRSPGMVDTKDRIDTVNPPPHSTHTRITTNRFYYFQSKTYASKMATAALWKAPKLLRHARQNGVTLCLKVIIVRIISWKRDKYCVCLSFHPKGCALGFP